MSQFIVIVALVVMGTTGHAQQPANNPHIGIAGSDFRIIPKGEWFSLLEQAVVVARTIDDQTWLFNFGENGRQRGKKFQSLLVERFCVAKQANFVSLDYGCVRQRQVWTWVEIKTFLREKMPAKEFRSVVNALEEYLRKQKLL